MAANHCDTVSYIATDQRPAWPYEIWTFTEAQGPEVITADHEEINKESHEKESSTTFTENKDYPESKDQNSCRILQVPESHDKVCPNGENSNLILEQEGNMASSQCPNDVCYPVKVESLHILLENKPKPALENQNLGTESDSVDDDEVVYEPDHWTDELESDIPETCPINALIKATASPDISTTVEAKQMRDAIMPMLESTLQDLVFLYKLFQGSFLLPVGSMAENTKVGKADEFDFAVILPVLAQKEFLGLLDKIDEVIPDKEILSLIGEIWVGDMETAANSVQGLLRKLWSSKMMGHVHQGWTVLNPSGHSDSSSVAATFHLQRELDKEIVDLDVCFWVPLDKDSLGKIHADRFPQKHFIAKHCLDEQGLVYVVLPLDTYAGLKINSVRFAMSVIERAALQKYGPDNGRLQCYRTCKCIVSALLPKLKKKEECDLCFDSLISSYGLKNIVLYMAANHTDDDEWTKEKLPNRVLEVFDILTLCMKANACQVSAYFTPYQLSIDSTLKYNPASKCVTDSEANWYETRTIPCFLPNLAMITELFPDDVTSQKAVTDYKEFLCSTEWRYPEVICRVTELLTNLAQVLEEDRKALVGEPGWNDFGLNLPQCESYVESVDTIL